MELVSVKYEYEYVDRDGCCVSIKPNERYILISKSNKDWWHVCKDQHTKPFYIPAQYVREVASDHGKLDPDMSSVSPPNRDKDNKPTIRPDRVTSKDSKHDRPKDRQPSDCTYTCVDREAHTRAIDIPKHSKKHRMTTSTSKSANTETLQEHTVKSRSGNIKSLTATPILNDQMEVSGMRQQMEALDKDSLDAYSISNIYETMPDFESREIDIYNRFSSEDGLNNWQEEHIRYPDEDLSNCTHFFPDYQEDNESPESAVYVNVAHLRQRIPESPPSPPPPPPSTCYAAPKPDPAGWEVHTDQESGQEYYYHPNTGRTTWDNPLLSSPTVDPDSPPAEEPCSPSLSPSPALPPAWEELVDETSGLPYFYNPMSGETSWEPPEPVSPYPALMEPTRAHRPQEGAPPPLPEEDYPAALEQPEGVVGEEEVFPRGSPTLPNEYSFSHVTRASIPRANLDRSGPAGWNLNVEPDGTWVFTSDHSQEQWIKSLDDRGQTYYYLRDGSKSQWNLPEAPMAPVHCKVGNGVQPDSMSVIKNWRHTMGPVQFNSAQEDEGPKFVPTHRRHASGSDTSSNSPEMHHQAYGLRPWRKPYYLTSRWLRYNVQNLEKAGILNKTKVSENGKKIRKSWAQSWTVLHGGVLSFHKDPKSTASASSNKTSQIVKEVEVDLRGATICWASKDKSSKKNVLELKSKAGVEFLVQYDTESIIGDWFKVLVDTIRQLEYQEHPSEEVEDGDLGDRCTDKNGSLEKKIGSRSQSSGSAAEADQKKVRTKLMKFLTKRPTLQSVKEKGYIRDNVFGCHLATLCTQEKTTVPKFVEKCINAVERRGLDIDGLYRVNGNLAVIQKLRYKADHEELDLEDGQWEDVHVITGALKLFFRELPEPLFPYSHFNRFISAIRTADYNAKVSYMRELVRSLPVPNHDTMELLFGHLHKVIEYGEDNRMTVQNVAIVFGPTLLRPETESANIAMHMIFQNQIVELVLNEYEHMFSFN